MLATAPYFVRLGASTLWDSNEAFYAETPREMIESGDYINPSFNYQPRFNKPPLSYWIVAFFYKLFGTSEATERVAIALAAVLMIAAAYKLAAAIFSAEAGLFAAIGLAASPRFLMFSRRIMIDLYLAMFMSFALLFFILAEKHPRRRRLFLALMYVSAGLGVMTKGPVAAILPALAFIIYLALFRRLKKLREMMLPAGIAIMAAIVLPWYVAIYHQHGWSYIEAFILRDNLSRYTEPVWGPRRGLFFYIPVMIGDLFPFSFFLVAALWIAARDRINRIKPLFGAKENDAVDNGHGSAMLVIWVIVIVGFFSFSRSKEDLYTLPAYPAVSALIGGLLSRSVYARTPAPDCSPVRWAAAVAGIVVSVAGGVVIYLFGAGRGAYDLEGARAIGFLAIAGGLAVVVAATIKNGFAAVAAVALTVITINWVFVTKTLPGFERFKPVRPLCEVIKQKAAPDSLVGYYRIASPSMVFYLGRPIFEYYKAEEIGQALASGKEVYCLMAAQDYEALKESFPVPTYLLASRPVFQVKLRGIFDRVEPPQVVIISNKGGTESER
jgi:4-amino-4-deoxy-L-arabinose transferase-like glycosyltransferase